MKIAFLTTDNREHFRDYESRQPQFGTAPEALLEGFAGLPEVEVHVLSCTQKPLQSPETLAPNIFYHSLHVPKIGWMRTLYQGCIRAVRAKLKKIQPDVVHGQGTERDNAISAVLSGFPSLLTIHGNMRLIAKVNRAKPFTYMWLSGVLERFTIPRARGVVCISRYTQRAVYQLAQQTWIVPNAVDQNLFNVRRLAAGESIILCVGYVTLRKNQNLFIRALDSLAKLMPLKVRFLGKILTKDSYGAEFLELIKTRPWCEYAGFANRDRLNQELSTASLLAMPSLEENCPMVVLEGMAAGIPIVAAKVGGIPDLLEDGVNGRLFDPTNSESIRAAVAQALEDLERSDAMAETAKRQAYERYHPKGIALQHLRIYEEVLS